MPNVDLLRTNFRKGQQFTHQEAGIITSSIKAIYKLLIKQGIIDSSGIINRESNPTGGGGQLFYLTAVASNPMTGQKTSYSECSYSLGESYNICKHPSSELTDYSVGDIVPAHKISGSWIANQPSAAAEASDSANGMVRWFSLSSAGGSILYGKEQSFNGTDWSDKSGALGSSEITIYPQIDNTQYHIGDKIAATSVNGFLVSLYNTPTAFEEC